MASAEYTRRLTAFYQEHNPLKTAVDVAETITHYVEKGGVKKVPRSGPFRWPAEDTSKSEQECGGQCFFYWS